MYLLQVIILAFLGIQNLTQSSSLRIKDSAAICSETPKKLVIFASLPTIHIISIEDYFLSIRSTQSKTTEQSTDDSLMSYWSYSKSNRCSKPLSIRRVTGPPRAKAFTTKSGTQPTRRECRHSFTGFVPLVPSKHETDINIEDQNAMPIENWSSLERLEEKLRNEEHKDRKFSMFRNGCCELLKRKQRRMLKRRHG